MGESQILTLSSEKGELGLINVIRVERADLETVETDGVVFDETKLVEEYEMSEALLEDLLRRISRHLYAQITTFKRNSICST